MDIFVSALTEAHLLVVEKSPASIVSFIDPSATPPYFVGYKKNNHLVLKLNDISQERSGLTPPGRSHIISLIDFLLAHDRQYAMVIHCLMGVSRSTAAAYIMLNLHYEGRELEIAQYLRAKIPHAQPNEMMIEHADNILGREGRMMSAIASLPRGNMATAGTALSVSTDFT